MQKKSVVYCTTVLRRSRHLVSSPAVHVEPAHRVRDSSVAGCGDGSRTQLKKHTAAFPAPPSTHFLRPAYVPCRSAFSRRSNGRLPSLAGQWPIRRMPPPQRKLSRLELLALGKCQLGRRWCVVRCGACNELGGTAEERPWKAHARIRSPIWSPSSGLE